MKIFLLSLSLFQLSWGLAVASEGKSKSLANITEGYIGNHSQYIDNNVFEKVSTIIQTQILPNNSVEQIEALIEPIRQKFYDQVHSQTASQLASAGSENAECLDISCLGTEVPSLILKVINSSLQVALSTINQEVSSLGSSADSSGSKAKPSETKANPSEPKALPAQNPKPSTQTPSQSSPTPSTTESHGAPHFVSSIPANAPGAPKFPSKGKRAQSVAGRPQTVSFIPKSATFDPVSSTSHVKKACLPDAIACNPLLTSLTGALKRSTDFLPQPDAPKPMPISQDSTNLGPRSHLRAISREPHNKHWKRRSPISFSDDEVAVIEIKSNPDDRQSEDSLSMESSSSDQPDVDEQITSSSSQINFNPDENIKVNEEFQESLQTILRAFLSDIETRFTRDHDSLWKNLTQEYSSPLHS